ncbi:MAG: ABC transporter permease [Planctomycetota bacterium]
MALPVAYSLRNFAVRRTAAIFTAFGIALTVAVFAGVLSLKAGFEQLYRPRGSDELAIFLRPGALAEGESALQRNDVDEIIKSRSEIQRDEQGRPLAAAETFLAVYMEKVDGGKTNVPLRGVQPMSIPLRGESVRLVEGRWMEFGTDEIVVGRPLTQRMRDCAVGDTLVLNMAPFRVVGVFESSGAEGGEVWGDVERMMEALQRPFFQRVIARLEPGTDVAALSEALEHDPRTPTTVRTEREYLKEQVGFTGLALQGLAGFLTVIMGISAVLGSMNTMLASVSARTHEIGVLLATGYSRISIFMAFLLEAALIGLLGGVLGLMLVLPFDGIETGLSNFNTFTDVSFAVTLTPELALNAFSVAFVLGLIGGVLPALRAALLKPVDAFRTL